MKSRLSALLCAAVLALAPALAAQAHEAKAGAITVVHPSVPAVAASADSAAGYFVVKNTGEEPDRLIGVEADFAMMAMLHASQTDAAGVSRMVMLDGVDVAPGGTVTFAPGGMHVMFTGLRAPLVEGAMMPGKLVFEHAGTVPVEFYISAPGKAPDMSGHDMSN